VGATRVVAALFAEIEPGHLATVRGEMPRPRECNQSLARDVLVGDTARGALMRIHRLLSLTDLVVVVVAAVAMFLPKRPIYAADPYRVTPEQRAALAASEARALARPDDGAAAADLSRRLSRAGMLDWAVEAGVEGAARATPPTRWQAQLAAAEAYGDRIEVQNAFDAAEQALGDCRAAIEACPDWEALKIELYMRYLEAGLQSGIDPRKQPREFRDKANQALPTLDIRGLTPGVPRSNR